MFRLSLDVSRVDYFTCSYSAGWNKSFWLWIKIFFCCLHPSPHYRPVIVGYSEGSGAEKYLHNICVKIFCQDWCQFHRRFQFEPSKRDCVSPYMYQLLICKDGYFKETSNRMDVIDSDQDIEEMKVFIFLVKSCLILGHVYCMMNPWLLTSYKPPS